MYFIELRVNTRYVGKALTPSSTIPAGGRPGFVDITYFHSNGNAFASFQQMSLF
jgi:hypothetical protein